MPTYEYICEGCGEKFDCFQSMTSPVIETHPNCIKQGHPVRRIVSGGSGLIFKGSGFYQTDYKNNKKDLKSEKNPKENLKKKTKANKEKQSKKGKLNNE